MIVTLTIWRICLRLRVLMWPASNGLARTRTFGQIGMLSGHGLSRADTEGIGRNPRNHSWRQLATGDTE
jgi:hypothetical protein